jgi:hypothetical protein
LFRLPYPPIQLSHFLHAITTVSTGIEFSHPEDASGTRLGYEKSEPIYDSAKWNNPKDCMSNSPVKTRKKPVLLLFIIIIIIILITAYTGRVSRTHTCPRTTTTHTRNTGIIQYCTSYLFPTIPRFTSSKYLPQNLYEVLY